MLASIDSVRVALQAIDTHGGERTVAGAEATSPQELLAAHTLALLGPTPAGRRVRIMVTVPTEAGSRLHTCA